MRMDVVYSQSISFTLYWRGIGQNGKTWGLFIFGWIFGYHQIMIALKDRYKIAFITNYEAFVWVVMLFGLKNAPPTYQQAVSTTFKDYLRMFMKLFLDDFSMFNNLDTHLPKLWLCFDKCREFGISLNLNKCMIKPTIVTLYNTIYSYIGRTQWKMGLGLNNTRYGLMAMALSSKVKKNSILWTIVLI